MCSLYCVPNYEPKMFATRREFLAVYHESFQSESCFKIANYLFA